MSYVDSAPCMVGTQNGASPPIIIYLNIIITISDILGSNLN